MDKSYPITLCIETASSVTKVTTKDTGELRNARFTLTVGDRTITASLDYSAMRTLEDAIRHATSALCGERCDDARPA